MVDTNESLPLLAEAGGLGFKRFGGYVSEEFHANLRGKLGTRVYREMHDNHPLIGGYSRGMRMLIRQADWPVKPADDSSEAHYWAEKLESSMYDMETPWRTVIDESLSMVPYGFCLLWTKYKLRRGDHPSRHMQSRFDDGLWGWRAFEIRKQDTIERWVYDEADETLIAAEQLAPPFYRPATLPMDRMVHLRFETSSGSPEGRSGYRNAYRSYYLQCLKEEIEGIGIARDLVGYPVMEVPQAIMHPNATADQVSIRTSMESKVRKIKRDELEGLVIPSEDLPDGKKSGYRFRLMSSGGSRAIPIHESISRDRVDIMISLLWEHALLGNTESGSRALSSDKTQLASVALGATMDTIAEGFNSQAVPRWCRLNRVPKHLRPEITHGDIEKENVSEWVTGLVAAAGGGLIVSTDEDEKKIREKLGLKQRGPGDEILGPVGGDASLAPDIGSSADADAPQDVAPGEAVKPTEALNGAQVTSLVDLISQVAAGELTRDSAIEVMTTAFPIDRARADRMLGPPTPMASAGPLPAGLPQAQPAAAPVVAPVVAAVEKDSDDEDPVMTAEEAAGWLRVSQSTIMRAIRNGKLPGMKVGNGYRVRRSDLIEWMQPEPAAPPAPPMGPSLI